MMKMIVIMFVFLVIEVKTFQFHSYYQKHPSSVLSLTNRDDHHHQPPHSQSSTRLLMMAKNKFKRSDFEGKDIFSEDDNDLPDDPAFSSAKRKANKKNNNNNPSDASTDNKRKVKLEPETVFFEGPPSASEIIFPAISVLTVIGIVPFISAVTRQFWVKYKFTSRRISIRSGFQGNTQTDVIYSDINEIKFVYRLFGAAGDMVLFLKDGAKVELRHVPKFEEIYNYVISKCDSECQEKSMKLKASNNNNNTSVNGNNNAETVNR